MNKGVEMILARMDSHPQEFVDTLAMGPFGRWTGLINRVMKDDIFTAEEQDQLNSRLKSIKRELFTTDVMKKLLDGPEQSRATDHLEHAAKFAQAYKKVFEDHVQKIKLMKLT